MKTSMIVCLLALLMLAVPGVVLAEEGSDGSTKFMEALVSQIKTLLDADNVLGTPLEFRDTKIIPIIGYGFGFGVGSGSGSHHDGQVESGEGGGAGGGIMPTSILVITKDGDVEVLGVQKSVLSDIMSTIAPIALEAIKTKQMESSEAPAAEETKAE